MENNTEENSLYHALKENYIENARGHLSEEDIRKTLQIQQELVDESLQNKIPPQTWMGLNIARYAKDLTRQKQPLFWLYYLLNFFTEGSMVLLMIHGIMTLITPVMVPKLLPSFVVLIVVCTLWKEWKKYYYRRKLRTKSIPKSGQIIIGTILFISVALLLLVATWKLNLVMHWSLLDTFLCYVGCICMCSVHNLLYQSHIVLFFQICLQWFRKESIDVLSATADLYYAQQNDREEQLRSRLSLYLFFLVIGFVLSATILLLCILTMKTVHLQTILSVSLSAVVFVLFGLGALGCILIKKYHSASGH